MLTLKPLSSKTWPYYKEAKRYHIKMCPEKLWRKKQKAKWDQNNHITRMELLLNQLKVGTLCGWFRCS